MLQLGTTEWGGAGVERLIMSGFAKIFASMLRSTVWVGQPPHVKLTWITLLMLADADGNVWASVPGLAKDAEVTVEQCDEALALFMAPDRRSRTKAHEGRRVSEIDGGWHIINHLKYRELQTRKQALHAARQRDYYERKKTVPPPGAGGFDVVEPRVSSVSADAPDAQVAVEAALYASKPSKPSKPSGRRSAKPRGIARGRVSADAPDDFAASASVISLAGSLDPDPDLIPSDPAKDRSARATPVSAGVSSVTGNGPLPSGVFDAPVLQAQAPLTVEVPEWWTGPKARHEGRAAEAGLDIALEADRFRSTHFQVPFPATPAGVDKRFDRWLIEGKVKAETERGRAFLQSPTGGGPRRGRMPTNGVAQLQPDEGRTGFEAVELPEPEPERPRRAARR